MKTTMPNSKSPSKSNAKTKLKKSAVLMRAKSFPQKLQKKILDHKLLEIATESLGSIKRKMNSQSDMALLIGEKVLAKAREIRESLMAQDIASTARDRIKKVVRKKTMRAKASRAKTSLAKSPKKPKVIVRKALKKTKKISKKKP